MINEIYNFSANKIFNTPLKRAISAVISGIAAYYIDKGARKGLKFCQDHPQETKKYALTAIALGALVGAGCYFRQPIISAMSVNTLKGGFHSLWNHTLGKINFSHISDLSGNVLKSIATRAQDATKAVLSSQKAIFTISFLTTLSIILAKA